MEPTILKHQYYRTNGIKLLHKHSVLALPKYWQYSYTVGKKAVFTSKKFTCWTKQARVWHGGSFWTKALKRCKNVKVLFESLAVVQSKLVTCPNKLGKTHEMIENDNPQAITVKKYSTRFSSEIVNYRKHTSKSNNMPNIFFSKNVYKHASFKVDM